ncbi:MAG TPA: hypothetical protein PKE64_25150 [Anaerolineae bacterium]|nr:hypothetical protein [Anaerolineae bacterium]
MSKQTLIPSVAYRGLRIGLLVISISLIVMSIAQAVETPPDSSTAFVQTSGPNAALNVGDFYTNAQGAQEDHFLRINIPCIWPADQTITFALFDPEIQEPDPPVSVEPPFADDEIRDDQGNDVNIPPDSNIQFADETTFTLFSLNNQNDIDRTVVEPVTFTPSLTNSTNGLWVELVTFAPNTPSFGCGVYALAASTADNDDNAWKLSVSHDPDCSLSLPGSPGSCAGIGPAQSELLSNGNEQSDADGTPGSGDELVISVDQLSYQHEAPGQNELTCQIFYHPVFENDAPEVAFNDFDLDINNSTGSNTTVRHISPSGAVIEGEPSSNESWNNAASPPPFPPERGRTVIQVGPADIGLWQTEICVRRDNQYIFEGQSDEIIFLEPPPAPVMTVVKDDGRTIVGAGEVLTYTIVFTNISNTNPRPAAPPLNQFAPGAAANVTLTDELPANTTFVNCRVNPPFSGPCSEGPTGIVTANINEIVVAGAGGTLELVVRVNADAPSGLITDTVQLDYCSAPLCIQFPPVTDTDVNEIPPEPPTPTPTLTPTPAPFPTPTSTAPSSGGDDDDDDDDGGGTSPTPPPPPAPTSAAVALAPAPPAPSPTPVVLYLPETGKRDGQGSWLMPGVGVLALISLIILTVWLRLGGSVKRRGRF